MQLDWEYNQEDAIGQMKEWTYPYTAYTGQYDLNFTDNEDGRNLYAKMQKIWGTVLPQLLLASSEEEFDEILKSCQEKWEQAGYERFCQLATLEIQQNKEKLGLTDEEN